jgi:hypothetical protein
VAEEHQQEEAEITAPGGFKIRARGYDLLVTASVVVVGLVAYMLYEHKSETATSTALLTGAIRELSAAQREMTCVISLPQERRELEFNSPNSLCKRISR